MYSKSARTTLNVNKENHLLTRENIICGASSAIMFAFAHVHHELWFISFFALVPFLWRLCYVNRPGALVLGMILATTYVFATSIASLVTAPQAFLFKLCSLNVAFAVFALAINRVRKHLGFNPLFIALLWFPLGYVLVQYADLNDFFYQSHAGLNLVSGFGSLLGILLWSFVIILGNSLILIFARDALRKLFRRSKFRSENDRWRLVHSIEPVISRHWYCVPNRRAPPTF